MLIYSSLANVVFCETTHKYITHLQMQNTGFLKSSFKNSRGYIYLAMYFSPMALTAPSDPLTTH